MSSGGTGGDNCEETKYRSDDGVGRGPALGPPASRGPLSLQD